MTSGSPSSTALELESPSSRETADDIVTIPASRNDRLEIQSLGSLHLRSGAEDFGPLLQQHPILSFIWLYLLARAALDPDDRISRAALADEVSPGIDAEDQRERLRGHLRDLRKLPAPLSSCLDAGSDFVGLGLTRSSFDVRRLVDLAKECERAAGLLSEAMIEEIHEVLAGASGEFLPTRDELEHQVTRGRGVAGEVIAEVRYKVEDAQTRLVAALGDCYLSRREANRAIPPLEEALRRRPEREELAQRLLTAYERVGQLTRAAQIRKAYAMDEKEPRHQEL